MEFVKKSIIGRWSTSVVILLLGSSLWQFWSNPLWLGAASAAAPADDDKKTERQYDQAVAAAINYLRSKGQAADGSFSAQAGPGVTAIVTAGVLRNGRSADDPMVKKALKYLERLVREDGGIYADGSRHKNYETSVALIAFSAANGDHHYDSLIKKADAFLRGMQWDETKATDKANLNYGGAGYGNSTRPDLSNTAFLIDALKAAGAGPEDEAIQKALVFVSRCQNLETPYNTTAFSSKNPDGGFYYTVAAGGASLAGTTEDGGLRSYGSMTYTGLKSMIFAGVGPDDPRVKAAYQWVKEHYDLETNPGLGSAGLYYYYHTFAKALDAVGPGNIIDSDGQEHDWRAELIAELARKQRPDGSWVNDNARWLESDANLVTGYALLTLSYCRAKK